MRPYTPTIADSLFVDLNVTHREPAAGVFGRALTRA